MIKWIAGAALMVITFHIGFHIERYYKKRADLYNDFLDFLRYTAREISHFKTNILTIIDDYTKCKKSTFSELLGKVRDDMINASTINIDTLYLKSDEIKEITKFFYSIEKSDFSSQELLLKRYDAEINEKACLFLKQKKDKGELAKKLCILLGIGIMIVLI
ncbi:MAG: stage III sporulation protein AB [Christensenellaceae bacterium]|nr:stage III sporulation protein AB [Christensenellaceae bacterium]